MSDQEVQKELFKINSETRPIWKKRRYHIVVLTFWAGIMIFVLRTNLSVAIISMVDKDFHWDSKTQGFVLSSFYYGYVITQLLGGWLSRKIGGHITVGAGIGGAAVLTLFSPLASYSSANAFIALRAVMGAVEGIAFTSIYELWSKWGPPLERSRLAGASFSGCYVGTVIAFSTCGVIAESLGWEWVFYISGIAGIVWWLCWILFVRASPETDPWISDEEKIYILTCLKRDDRKINTSHVPWVAIFTSLPVYAIVISHFSENWGFHTMLTQLPTYLKNSLEFDLSASGFLSSVPYLSLGISVFFVGYLADWVQKRGFLTTSQTRKYFNCFAFLAQTVFMFLAAYQTDKALIIVFLTLGAAIGSFGVSGFGVNHLDIAPNYASILVGISATIASVPGILSPLVTGYIVTDQTNSDQWKWIFIIAAIFYLTGCITFWFMSSGEAQSWAHPKLDKASESEFTKSVDTLSINVNVGDKKN